VSSRDSATTIGVTAFKTEWTFAAGLAANGPVPDNGLGLGNDPAPDNGLQVGGPAQGNVLRADGRKRRSDLPADEAAAMH
jgi:hypothetical protein